MESLVVRRIVDAARILDADSDLALTDLVALQERLTFTDEEIDALARPDPRRPYGRRVLMATDNIEVMVATWTRGLPCAPHDHGGQWGAVKVLRGRSRHRLWSLADGALSVRDEHTVDPDGIIRCGPDVIHSMGDDGAEAQLVTLHLYTRSIPHMVVYDLDSADTYVVDGGCGAWIPHDDPRLIKAHKRGLLPRHELLDDRPLADAAAGEGA